MSKRLQVIISDEAFQAIEKSHRQVIEGHPAVRLNYSDVIEAMVLSSKISVSELRLKHTDLRRTLLDLAKRKDLDDDEIIKSIADLKGILNRKDSKKLFKSESVTQE